IEAPRDLARRRAALQRREELVAARADVLELAGEVLGRSGRRGGDGALEPRQRGDGGRLGGLQLRGGTRQSGESGLGLLGGGVRRLQRRQGRAHLAQRGVSVFVRAR